MTDLIEAPIETEAPEPPGSIGALLRLIGITALLVAGFVLLGWGALLVVIVALIAMVMLHEFGHFATAKWAGMKATEFFVGFGPRLWSVRKGETEYGVKAIPAGGYVRIIGMTSAEEIDPSDEPRAYRNQPFAKRIVVASAGSAMHFLLAFILAFCALAFIGKPDPSVIKVQGYLNFGNGVHTPAQIGGIRSGDQIIKVDGVKVTDATALSTAVHHHAPGTAVTITVLRAGHPVKLTVTPVDGRSVKVNGKALAPTSGPATGYLGVSLAEGSSTVGPLSALVDSAGVVRQVTVAAGVGMYHLFSPAGIQSYAHQVANPSSASSSVTATAGQAPRPESIVGAVRTATQATHAGILPLLEVLISINIFIGILNMLPMLPLDGGHVAIASYEWMRTRRGRPMYRADVRKLMPAVYLFVGLLLALVMSSLYLDLTHPAANPFR